MNRTQHRPGFAVVPDFPFYYTPFTNLTDHWGSFQKGPCAGLEMDYARCSGAVGHKRSVTECSKYWEDLMECALGKKRVSICIKLYLHVVRLSIEIVYDKMKNS